MAIDTAGIQDQPVRTALETLLRSDELVRSPQLAKFLRYIVEARLDGNEQNIKAYSIAVDVFGRPPDFDPQTDPIVRVQARRLRAILERYYSSGASTGGVRISMPTGRYIPDFVVAEPHLPESRPAKLPPPAAATPIGSVSPRPEGSSPAEDVAAESPTRVAAERDGARGAGNPPVVGKVPTIPAVSRATWTRRWWVVPGLAAVVLLAIAGGLLLLPAARNVVAPPAAPAAGLPAPPIVFIGSFSNLSGIDSLDSVAARLKDAVAGDLSAFADLAVATEDNARPPPASGSFLTGLIRRTASGIEVSALLAPGIGGAAVWSTTVDVPLPDDPKADATVAEAARLIAARAAAFRGPLHAAGRAWLDRQPGLESGPSLYTCMLRFRLFSETEQSTDAAVALSCFDKLRKTVPSPVVEAAWSWLEARVTSLQTPSADLLPAAIAPFVSVARQAAHAAPQNAFVYTQMARVLDSALDREGAKQAFVTAIKLNPADLDTLAASAQTLALSGDDDGGMMQANAAIAAAPNPPSWYYAVSMIVSYKRHDYQSALNSSLVYAANNHEVAQLMAVASAAWLKRQDVIDQFLPGLLLNERYRRNGFLNPVGLRVTDKALLASIGDGLALAGVPQADMRSAF